MDTVKSLQEYRNDSEIIWYIRQLCKQFRYFHFNKTPNTIYVCSNSNTWTITQNCEKQTREKWLRNEKNIYDILDRRFAYAGSTNMHT